jgi:Domain of unknown function (DUF4926)
MKFKEYDVVALTQEIQAMHKETQQPILLRHRQGGTILMDFEGRAYLVDFSDAQGNTYAMETVPTDSRSQAPAWECSTRGSRLLDRKRRQEPPIGIPRRSLGTRRS